MDVYTTPTESPVPGKYEGAEVSGGSIKHFGEEKAIRWINKYAFYFHFCPGNDQIWVYDTARNCMFQIYNGVAPGILGKPIPRISPAVNTSENYYGEEPKKLGSYRDVVVHDTFLSCGENTRNIAWINPLTFYYYYGGTNEQIWTFDPTVDGYLQLHSAADSVISANNRAPAVVHNRVF